jgi:AAHS family 4-hydroxybenzoate transporter-like MFS transporter
MPPHPRIEVRQFIDNQRFSPFQWRVLALCFLITALDGLDTAAIGFVAPALTKAFNVSREALGPTLGAALIGYAVGALIAGPLSDRIGRRVLTIASVVMFGFWCLVSGFADSLGALVVLRFLTGIGLGAAMPNATALMSEYAPARSRSLLVTTMFCGFTLGSAGGGILAAWLIPLLGWRSVLYAGGILPLLAIPLLLLWLPESTRFLVTAGASTERVGAILRRIAPAAVPQGATFHLDEGESEKGAPTSFLFTHGRAAGTLLLWLAFFMGLLVIYLLTSWLPTIIHDAGFTISEAARVGALWQIGGTVGALLVGWAMDRTEPHLAIAASYLLGAGFIYWASHAHNNLLLISLGIAGAGFCVSGAQTSMTALAAIYYPTRGRATGISWMLGIGRFGAIAGALFGGVLVSLVGSLDAVMAALALPILVAALAVAAKLRLGRPADRPLTHNASA